MKKIKKFFGKVKKFFGNLAITLKVQKGALLKILSVILAPVVVALGFATLVGFVAPVGFLGVAVGASWTPLAIATVATFAVWVLTILVWIINDYREAVKKAASIEVKKANAKGYKARKNAEKLSIKSQNEAAKAREIEAKYAEKK